MKTKDTYQIMKQLKKAIRKGYAWPGGYEIIGITNDGSLLCNTCLKSEYLAICHDTVKQWTGTGWCLSAIDTASNLDDPNGEYCDHCNREIQEPFCEI